MTDTWNCICSNKWSGDAVTFFHLHTLVFTRYRVEPPNYVLICIVLKPGWNLSQHLFISAKELKNRLVSCTWAPTEAVSAPSFVHPSSRVGAVGWRVKPGHAEFGWMTTDWQVFVLRTDGAAELLVVALVTAASWKRRWQKNDESRDGKMRDWECGEKGGGSNITGKKGEHFIEKLK